MVATTRGIVARLIGFLRMSGLPGSPAGLLILRPYGDVSECTNGVRRRAGREFPEELARLVKGHIEIVLSKN
jgi:hypothetical protein